MSHYKNNFLCRCSSAKCLSLFLSLYLTLAPGFAFALPSDPTVRNGSVSFNQVDSKTLNIIQSSDKAIIDWNSFNIQKNEATHFQLPSANSINVSRVTGGVSSSIFGTLTSNGKLMLINPNGILFGKNSRVDVNGLVATTSDINNSDFISGNYHFSISPEINRTVINRGTINIKQGGLLAFVAPGVENSGIINAKLGQISLASGKTFTLDLYGDKLVSLGIDSKILNQVIGPDGTPVSSLVANGGSIHANGGNVFLGVKAARNVVDQVINMDGIIEAQTAFKKDGKIVLLGGDEGLVKITGTLDASGKDSGQLGGNIQVMGEWVALLDNAFIDVSGDLGGGTALIGGDYQGKGLYPNAQKTYFSVDSSITADAISSGDGGKVVLWSDDATYFKGSISAKGGSSKGDGGFVEVSSKNYLNFNGSVDVASSNGNAGTVLLDPASITILSGVDSNSDGFTAASDVSELFANDSGDSTVLNPAASGSFDGISAGSTIILQATGDITVSSDFVLATATGTANNSLVMQAGENINVNQNITVSGTGTLHLEADSKHSSSNAGDGTGTILIANGAAITTANTAATLIGADFDFIGTLNTGSGNVTIGQSVTSQSLALGSASSTLLTDTELDLITTTGTLTIGQATTAGSDGAGTSASTLTSAAITSDGLTLGSKNIALVSGSTVDLGSLTTTGTLSVTSSGAVTDSGALAITGTTTIAAGSGNDITLDGTSNNFTGAVIITSGNNVTLVDAGAIDLGASTVSGTYAVTATSGGDITDSGVLAITGASTLTVASGQSITLDQSSTFTGAVSFASGGTIAGVTIKDSGAFDLAALTITGNLTVTAGGAVTDSGTLVVPGTATISASGQAVTLDQTASNFGTIAITGANVAVTDTNALILGAATVSGTYAITAGGALTDSGTQEITGATTISASGQAVTLDTSTNNFAAAVGITGANVAVTDEDAIDLGASTVSGTYGITATAGDITDSGVLAITGATTLTAASGQSITLDSASTYSSTVAFSSGGTLANVTIDDSTVLDLAALTLSGNLSVTSGGNITDSGVLNITGTSSFTTDVSNSTITLNNTNILTGTVSLNTTGASANATIDNGTTGLVFTTSTIGGNLTATSGDSITDSGVITVGGTASFTTDTTDKLITLNSENAITGQVTFDTTSTGGDVIFNNGTTAISLGTIASGDIGGDLTLLTDADQTISNAITLGGSGAELSITVDNANSLTVQAALTTNAGAITLSADDDVIFTAAGDLTTANGNITVSADDDSTSDAASGGALTMVDGTVFNSSSGTITASADEDITIGQMTTTSSSTSAIKLSSVSSNILDGDTDGSNDLTAASGTVYIADAELFGSASNALEVSASSTNTSGVTVVTVTSTADTTLSGSTETIGDTSVGQTVSIASGLDKSVSKTILTPSGTASKNISQSINTGSAGPGPIVVDVFSESFELIKVEGGSPDLASSIEKMDNVWSGESKTPANTSNGQSSSTEEEG